MGKVKEENISENCLGKQKVKKIIDDAIEHLQIAPKHGNEMKARLGLE